MMSTRGGAPDAWDDDWISKADVGIIIVLESTLAYKCLLAVEKSTGKHSGYD